MKKLKAGWYGLGLALAAFVGVNGFAASSDWEDLKGCYSTVSFNGQPGGSGLENRGWAELDGKFYWATMPGADGIRAFDFTLYNYQQGNTTYMGSVWIFPDYGVTTKSNGGRTRTYSFNGPMICTGMCNQPYPFTYETKVEITDLGNDLFQVHNFRRIPELPDHSMDADDTYVIKRERENCWMDRCVKNPDGSVTCS